MSMSKILGEVYGTTKTASAPAHTDEDAQKLAQATFFNNLCKQAGIDITKCTDEQVAQLYKIAQENGGMPFGGPPAASAPPSAPPEKKEEKKEEDKEEEEKKEKEAAARREYEEKRAMVEKLAEADAFGRVMAHAYLDELKKIAEAEAPPPAEKKEEEKKEEEEKKAHQARAEALIAKFASQSGGSSTRNFDEQAALYAVEMLKAAEYSPELAYARINAVYTLGLPESTKIASVNDYNKALELRAYEFCEAAKFPVDWSKV